jgi:regulator of sigma E protease
VTWVIAIAGFCALIVAHEAGHFLAAKAVGMRVERFSLFFPPKIASFRAGETEYQIGALPLGGYVKITGMTPDELRTVDLRLADRSYYMKEPWKRIVVILAGPGVNLLLAFVLFSAVLLTGSLDGATAIGNLSSQQTLREIPGSVVDAVPKGSAAAGLLKQGDRIVAIDGHAVNGATLDNPLQRLHCAGPTKNGCRATGSASVTVVRDHRRLTVQITPHYDSGERKMILGITPNGRFEPLSYSLGGALSTGITTMWDAASSTVTAYVKSFVSSKQRKQLSSIVGITEDTQQAVTRGPGFALVILALISLVLAVVNLFPFLPLDGGHVLWSLGEKLRGKRISLLAMYRYSSVGIVLLLFLVINGVSNDISRLAG